MAEDEVVSEEERLVKLTARYEVVRHMALAALAGDARGGVSAYVHECISLCQGKHPPRAR